MTSEDRTYRLQSRLKSTGAPQGHRARHEKEKIAKMHPVNFNKTLKKLNPDTREVRSGCS